MRTLKTVSILPTAVCEMGMVLIWALSIVSGLPELLALGVLFGAVIYGVAKVAQVTMLAFPAAVFATGQSFALAVGHAGGLPEYQAIAILLGAVAVGVYTVFMATRPVQAQPLRAMRG